MGSFTEIVLCFSFVPETPAEVLAAFSALHVPRAEPHWSDPEPELPAPFATAGKWYHEDWDATNELRDPAQDPEPWKHAWAAWVSRSMSVQFTPHAQLVWSDLGRWTVSCRWGMKSHPECILPALLWLGPHLERNQYAPTLLGYMQYETETRPVLVWLNPDGTITGEDLNTGDRHH